VLYIIYYAVALRMTFRIACAYYVHVAVFFYERYKVGSVVKITCRLKIRVSVASKCKYVLYIRRLHLFKLL